MVRQVLPRVCSKWCVAPRTNRSRPPSVSGRRRSWRASRPRRGRGYRKPPFFVFIGDGGDSFGKREYDVKVLAVEPFRLPVPAGIERIPLMAALIAMFHVTAQRRRPAQFNGGHDAPLPGGERRGMIFAIGFAVAAEHVRYFESGAIHWTPHGKFVLNGRVTG